MVQAGPSGELAVLGRLTEASNATFLTRDDAEQLWVYKPVAGEAPLWDFPHGTLSRREVAAHLVSEHYGYGVVPLTLWIEGPAGPGSVQRWFDGQPTPMVDLLSPKDLDETWRPVVTGVDAEENPIVLAHRGHPVLRRICLFDLVINNSDRKAGHLIDNGERVLGVDHGVSLHTEDKFRTVLWGFAGEPLTPAEALQLGDVAALGLARPEGLSQQEWEAMGSRAERLLETGTFPSPTGRWPAIPWPAW